MVPRSSLRVCGVTMAVWLLTVTVFSDYGTTASTRTEVIAVDAGSLTDADAAIHQYFSNQPQDNIRSIDRAERIAEVAVNSRGQAPW